MTAQTFRNRAQPHNVPPPISPRPNRERSPLHVPTVLVFFGLDTITVGSQATIPDTIALFPRIHENDFFLTGTTVELDPWRAGVTWFPAPFAYAIHIDVFQGGFWTSVSTFTGPPFGDKLDFWTGLQPWPGIESNASNWVGIQFHGPWTKYPGE